MQKIICFGFVVLSAAGFIGCDVSSSKTTSDSVSRESTLPQSLENSKQLSKEVVSNNRAMHLQVYGAKITEVTNGIAVDLRNASNFDDQAIDLLLSYSDEIVDLTLQNVSITDTGIEKLSPLKNVGRLILNETAITGQGLAHLAQFPLKENLWCIGLRNARIKDSDVNLLVAFPKLLRIDLTGTKVTNAGIQDLPEREWQMINLKATLVTESGIRQLMEKYPKADIRH